MTADVNRVADISRGMVTTRLGLCFCRSSFYGYGSLLDSPEAWVCAVTRDALSFSTAPTRTSVAIRLQLERTVQDQQSPQYNAPRSSLTCSPGVTRSTV